jgi:hypothetical protein
VLSAREFACNAPWRDVGIVIEFGSNNSVARLERACRVAFEKRFDLGRHDAEKGRLAQLLPRLPDTGEALRVRRARLAFPGNAERFADLWLARTETGLRTVG